MASTWKPSSIQSTSLKLNCLSKASLQNLWITNCTVVIFGSPFSNLWQSSVSFLFTFIFNEWKIFITLSSNASSETLEGCLEFEGYFSDVTWASLCDNLYSKFKTLLFNNLFSYFKASIIDSFILIMFSLICSNITFDAVFNFIELVLNISKFGLNFIFQVN